MPAYKRVLSWAQRNERHLGALVFVFGFATDIFTFGELELSWVSLVFVGYLLITAIAILITHYLYSKDTSSERPIQKTFRIMSPLVAQFCIGSLLSGTLIFYTRSATLFVSWPFLFLLGIIFFGNEYFRKYKERLTFQAIQFFIVIYSYTLFALPFYTHTLTKQSFLFSTLITLSVSLLFFCLLFYIGKQRFIDSFKRLLGACTLLTLILIGSYYTGILPPLPLSLKDVGVYHSLERSGDQYTVQKEQDEPWYTFFRTQTLHVTEGEMLYGYSAVFAPGAFSTDLMHTWERYDPTLQKWVLQSRIAFPLSGGRDAGYRGYSYISATTPGLWRLSVLSESEQVLGRVQFQVENVDVEPTLETVTK